MTTRIEVGPAADLPPGQGVVVDGGREAIAVFNADGAYYACSDACPHAGGPLHQGFIEDRTVHCPWHGWTFDLVPRPDAPPDGVHRYRVVQVGATLYVEMDD